MSASKDYPALPSQPPFATVAKLTDLAIISWDSQGTMTLPHLGMEVAEECIFRTTGRMTTDFEAEPAIATINASRKFGIERAKAGAKFFIHDTVSTKDTRITSYWTKMIDDDPKQGNDAGIKLYRNVLKTHAMDLEFWQNLAAHHNACNIWLCHTDIKGQDAPVNDAKAKAAVELQRASKGLLGAELAARITGKSWNYFHENVRAVYYQTVEQSFGKPVAMWTTRSTEIAVKPGFPDNVLPSKMPADFRLLFKVARGEK
jgi:hypothetical protein